MRLVLWSVITSAVLLTGCCTTQRVAEYPLPILPPAPSIVTWHRSAFHIYLTVLQVPRATSYVIEGYTAENGTWNIQVPVTPSPLLPGQTFDTSIVSPHGGETLPFRRLASWASRAARGHRIVLPVPPPKTP